jgi:hypothetical protein
MGIFSFSTKKNPVNDLERAVAKEASNVLTLNELRRLSFNPKNHISYIVSEICFAFETVPQFKNASLKAEYKDFFDNEKKKEAFKMLYDCMKNYYKGIPNINRAMWNLTSAYFITVWDIQRNRLENVIELTALSVYFTQIRHTVGSLVDNIIIEKLMEVK